MKRIYSYGKYISPLVLTVIVTLFWSCEDETKAEDNKHPEELVGTWYYTDGDYYTEITTNSSQTIGDQFSEGIGSIDVSGDVTATLTYMAVNAYDDELSIHIVNQRMTGYPDFPVFSIEIDDSEGYFSAMCIVFESMDQYSTYSITDTIYYSYDADTYTLTIDSTDFMKFNWDTYEFDSSSVLTVSGTLQNLTISIPANTPTQVGAYDYLIDYISEFSITLEEDGSWLRTTVLEFWDETETETGIGSWELDNDELIVIEKVEDYSDTLRFSYTVSGNTLTLILEEAFCEDEYEDEYCLKEYEWEYGLESGSLTNIIGVYKMNFSKTAPTTRISAKLNIRHLFQSRMSQHKRVMPNPFR